MHIWSLTTSLASFSTSLPLAYSFSATWESLLLLSHIKYSHWCLRVFAFAIFSTSNTTADPYDLNPFLHLDICSSVTSTESHNLRVPQLYTSLQFSPPYFLSSPYSLFFRIYLFTYLLTVALTRTQASWGQEPCWSHSLLFFQCQNHSLV